MTPEGKVKAAFIRELKALPFPGRVWSYMPVPSGRGRQALDMLLCVRGEFVAVEFKAPGKKPTPLQEDTILAINNAGGLAFVVDGSSSVYSVIDYIRRMVT